MYWWVKRGFISFLLLLLLSSSALFIFHKTIRMVELTFRRLKWQWASSRNRQFSKLKRKSKRKEKNAKLIQYLLMYTICIYFVCLFVCYWKVNCIQLAYKKDISVYYNCAANTNKYWTEFYSFWKDCSHYEYLYKGLIFGKLPKQNFQPHRGISEQSYFNRKNFFFLLLTHFHDWNDCSIIPT